MEMKYIEMIQWDTANCSNKVNKSINPLLSGDQDQIQTSMSLGVEGQKYSALGGKLQLEQCVIGRGELLECPCNSCLFEEFISILQTWHLFLFILPLGILVLDIRLYSIKYFG